MFGSMSTDRVRHLINAAPYTGVVEVVSVVDPRRQPRRRAGQPQGGHHLHGQAAQRAAPSTDVRGVQRREVRGEAKVQGTGRGCGEASVGESIGLTDETGT